MICRMCKSSSLEPFLDLGVLPLANSFVTSGTAPEQRFPLQVCVCSHCWLSQLVYVIDKSRLFRDYIYFSSGSSGIPKLSKHFEQYAKEVAERFLKPGDFVLELGSNDGVLLSWFKENGQKILGVDPARNIAKTANENGIPTLPEFFSKELAERIAKEQGLPELIIANNTVAHIDDYQELFGGISNLLAPDGVFVFEAPYLVDMFENLTYDTIYHEHLSYFTVRPFVRFLERFGLEMFDVKVTPTQGQSLRIFVGHEGAQKKTGTVANLIAKEMEMKLDDIETYHELAKRVEESRIRLKQTLKDLKERGKRIAGYGAPAKGNTVLNYCGIGTETLDYILDDMPSKQGLLTPGTHVPVVSHETAKADPPDVYLLLAWNYKEDILKREQAFIENGGTFITPV